MNIAISASSPRIDGTFDPRFGRCRYFIHIDVDTKEWQAVKNPGFHSSGGAGTSAAQFIARKDADAVISGRFGPHAYSALEAADIQMYQAEGSTVSSVLDKYLAHELQQAAGKAHSGRHRRGRRSHSR